MSKSKKVSIQDDPLGALVKFFSSFGLGAALFTLLTVLTLFGTLNQVDDGLYESVKTYFYSWLVVDNVMGIPVLLPGGLTLGVLLFINILLGTLIQIRRKPEKIGLYMCHFGILFMIASDFVTRYYAWEGYIAFFEGNTAARVTHHHDWQLEIAPLSADGAAMGDAFVIPDSNFKSATSGSPRTFKNEDLPFDLIVEQYEPNARPLPKSLPVVQSEDLKEVGEHVLYPLPKDGQNERNTPGLYAKFAFDNGEPVSAIIPGDRGVNSQGDFIPPKPFTLTQGDKKWNILLRQKQFLIPFDIRLDKFHADFHPGTGVAKNYQSDVTKLQKLSDGSLSEERIKIKMNEPLRYDGYTFFQSSYGQNTSGNYYSQLTVWNNPADHWPLYSIWIIGLGLFVHFGMKLGTHLGRSGKTSTKTSN